MKRIELELWEPSQEDPRILKYMGQPKAAEVFKELKYRLETQGCLPDEYFLLDLRWENGREIPKDSELFCTVNYGGSEGIYIDIYLKWYEDGWPVTKSFIGGKTLEEGGDALDRMFLTASAVTKAFYGARASHARYIRMVEAELPRTKVFSLNVEEQQIIVNALLSNWHQKATQISDEEKLLRRLTGSITEYVNQTGQLPMTLNAYDRAVLAIRDENVEEFEKVYSEASEQPVQAAELLSETAGRPGPYGRKMMSFLLSDDRRFSQDDYLRACQKVVSTGDLKRLVLLVENAEHCIENITPAFYGAVIRNNLMVYPENDWMAEELFRNCTPEQKENAPSDLLLMAVIYKKESMAQELIENGIHANVYAAEIIRRLKRESLEWLTESFTTRENCVSIHNFSALRACMETEQIKAAENLLDRGMDFKRFQIWMKDSGYRMPDTAKKILEDHWKELQLIRKSEGAPKLDGQQLV